MHKYTDSITQKCSSKNIRSNKAVYMLRHNTQHTDWCLAGGERELASSDDNPGTANGELV